jgi:hypothetical protein
VFILRKIQAAQNTGCLLLEQYEQYRAQGVYWEITFLNVKISCKGKQITKILMLNILFKKLCICFNGEGTWNICFIHSIKLFTKVLRQKIALA